MRKHPALMLAVLWLASACCVMSQTTPPQTGERTWKFGGELDVLAYATQGYYGSGFAGRDGWRVRGVVSRVNVPGFFIPDGFEKLRTDAYVAAVDRFFGARRRNLEGFWVGPGIEVWRNRVRREGFSQYVNFHNVVATIGAGYVWKLTKHFYVNPWVAGHFVAGGDRTIQVSGRTYEQRLFTPEGSVKFGFVF